jgi:TPR repeat protein
MSMPEDFRDPQRTLLFSGVAAAAVLAAVGAFLFFANVPAPGAAVSSSGAAREQILAASPKMDRADIDRIVAARNAFAPRPSQVAKAELAEDAIRPRRDASGTLTVSASDATPEAAAPSAVEMAAVEPRAVLRAIEPQGNQGDILFQEGNFAAAISYWQGEAQRGDRWSAYRLGVEYLDGKPNVVKRDVTAGTRWIRFAAEHNEPRAQFELGTLYEAGTIMKTDLAAAAGWYLKAAERGHVNGQYNIATMLEAGDGIARDAVEALKFYTLAARQGFITGPVESGGRARDLPSALMNLRSRLSADEVQEAERRAAAFKPIED